MATKFKNSVEIDGYLSISSGNWIQVPDGTDAQRPGSPAVGMFRYNTTSAEFEGYFGATPAWGAIGGGGGGSVTEAFKTFAVSGQTSIVADGPTDTLTVAAGNNISLTTDAATDTLTIASTGGGGGTVTVQRNNYTADGVTVAYGVSATVITENNLQVYLDGVYQDKDGFTATGNTLTFGTAPLNGTEIEIMHFVAVDGVIEVDEFVGDGSQVAFATSLSIINENATQVYVSGVYQSKLTYGTTGNVVTFTTAPPNGVNVEVVHIKALALSGFNKNNFTGDGSTTVFTLNTTVTEENMSFVFMQGIYQDKSTYAISGTSLTFATAPQNTYEVEVMVLGAISASTNALYTDTFTGDGSQVAYSLGITPVDINAIEVYLNGLYQNISTLSLAANVVTFATAPPNGVTIEMRSVGFLNSGGTLAPATLTGGTGISVVTNSPNNFTISNTLIDTTVSWATPSGQSLTYTAVSPQTSTGQAGSILAATTFTVTDPLGGTLSGTAALTGLPSGFTYTQGYNNANPGNILTITISGVYPSSNSLNIGLVLSGLTIAPPLLVDYLVIAGGGGGGANENAGGGGAGGYRNSFNNEASGGGGSSETTPTLLPATDYTITVGAGGAGGATGQNGSNGTNSVFTSITSIGGGGGGKNSSGIPNNGGSGGGQGYYNSGFVGSGTSNQGYAGGTATSVPSNYGGGGGGGAGGIGASGGSSSGIGGAGLLSSITETSTPRASGGSGGGNTITPTATPGGGSIPTINATANTGGGGGGGSNLPTISTPGMNGGSGIVILRYSSTYSITPASGSGGFVYTTDTTTVSGTSITIFTAAGGGNIQFN